MERQQCVREALGALGALGALAEEGVFEGAEVVSFALAAEVFAVEAGFFFGEDGGDAIGDFGGEGGVGEGGFDLGKELDEEGDGGGGAVAGGGGAGGVHVEEEGPGFEFVAGGAGEVVDVVAPEEAVGGAEVPSVEPPLGGFEGVGVAIFIEIAGEHGEGAGEAVVVGEVFHAFFEDVDGVGDEVLADPGLEAGAGLVFVAVVVEGVVGAHPGAEVPVVVFAGLEAGAEGVGGVDFGPLLVLPGVEVLDFDEAGDEGAEAAEDGDEAALAEFVAEGEVEGGFGEALGLEVAGEGAFEGEAGEAAEEEEEGGAEPFPGADCVHVRVLYRKRSGRRR